jgi:hypothetical protein
VFCNIHNAFLSCSFSVTFAFTESYSLVVVLHIAGGTPGAQLYPDSAFVLLQSRSWQCNIPHILVAPNWIWCGTKVHTHISLSLSNSWQIQIGNFVACFSICLTEWYGCSTPISCSKVPNFETWPGEQLYWLEIFCAFLNHPSQVWK